MVQDVPNVELWNGTPSVEVRSKTDMKRIVREIERDGKGSSFSQGLGKRNSGPYRILGHGLSLSWMRELVFRALKVKTVDW